MEEPYCTCVRGRLDGFGCYDGVTWVHAACRKISKTVHDKELVAKIMREHGLKQETYNSQSDG